MKGAPKSTSTAQLGSSRICISDHWAILERSSDLVIPLNPSSQKSSRKITTMAEKAKKKMRAKKLLSFRETLFSSIHSSFSG